MNAEGVFPPEPNLADSEAGVDLELVQVTVTVNNLDREIGELGFRAIANDPAFIGLDACFLEAVRERPRAGALEQNFVMIRPDLYETPQQPVPRLMVAARHERL